ncbi:MAG: hypothetical protein WKF63_01650 [Thermomicrobiales bacterium]
MNTLADAIKSTLLAREAIGVVLIAACALAMQVNRPFLREVWNDPSRFWRVTARLAATLALAALVWMAAFDDWLQLVAEPYRLSMPWEYQRVVFDPIDPALRAGSVVLIVAMLAVLACLFARHIGGYPLQLGTLVLSALIWTPIFIMNQRLNAMIVQGAEASETLPQVLGLSAFWVVRMGLGVVTIAATLMTGIMLLALVATVFLDLFGLRQQRITHEADGFFTELQRRAGQREDIPLKTLWRPIRRPL